MTIELPHPVKDHTSYLFPPSYMGVIWLWFGWVVAFREVIFKIVNRHSLIPYYEINKIWVLTVNDSKLSTYKLLDL